MSAQSRPGLVSGGEWLFDTIKRNPEGLLLVAAGAVLMMRTAAPRPAENNRRNFGPQTPEEFGDTVERGAQNTQSAAAAYASSASDAVRQTMDAAKSYATSAPDYAQKARRAIGEQSEKIVQQTQTLAQGILQNQPLAIAVAGLAAGAALAAAFPPTDLEKQTLGPVGDRVSKAAEQVGDQLKQATAKAGEKLKSAADDRGLNVEGLKEVAGEVADAFKATMAGGPDAGARENFPPAENQSGGSERNR
jgi:hypothetical protein